VRRIGPVLEMIEGPSDHDWIFDAGNHLDSAAAPIENFDISVP
jgi:hypothetical protein